MRASWFDQFGDAATVLRLGELDTPTAAAGEVLVRLHTSAVNPSDVKKRAGAFPQLLDNGLVVPNSDGAGVIEAVGADVDTARIGERVWVYQGQHERRFGTAADYIAIDQRRAVLLPDAAGFDVGACLGIPAMTSHRAVFADGDVNGLTVLVTGGAGRVGHYAVQWAAAAGARVIATASNDADTATCESAGAAAVVNHRSDAFANDILAANQGQRIDRIVDLEFGANLDTSLDVLKTSGTIATYGSAQNMQPTLPFYRMMYMDLLLRFIIVYAMPESAKQQAADAIVTALENATLAHRIAKRLPLGQSAAAHEAVESATLRGAMILDIAEGS